MRPPPRLSNVYTPTVLAPAPGQQEDRKQRVLAHRQERQQRGPHELRRLRMDSGLVRDAAGSALVQLGDTQVLCTVTGPVTSSSSAVPNHVNFDMDEGVLHVDVQYAPALLSAAPAGGATFNLQDASVTPIDPNEQQQQHQSNRTWMVHRETDLASRVASALQAAVPLRPYPKCAIAVQLTVLQDDGGVLPVCVTAAVAALAQARIELYDVVAACCVAVVQQQPQQPQQPPVSNNSSAAAAAPLLLADPTRAEMEIADCVVTLALLPNWKEVTLWEQQQQQQQSRGEMISKTNASSSQETTNAAVNLCRDGCRTMHKFLREHLLEQQQNMEI